MLGINKYFLLIFLLLGSWSALALEGMVTVLHAPLWKKPQFNSVIVQYAKKGERLTIVDKPSPHSGFIPVWDKLAKIAYIQAKYIKVFSEDLMEQSQISINKDPTDYRPNEPLAPQYKAPIKKAYDR